LSASQQSDAMTAQKIRALPIPFVDTPVLGNTRTESVHIAITTTQLVFLREIAAQLAEMNERTTANAEGSVNHRIQVEVHET
jgi:hypothetical protein